MKKGVFLLQYVDRGRSKEVETWLFLRVPYALETRDVQTRQLIAGSA